VSVYFIAQLKRDGDLSIMNGEYARSNWAVWHELKVNFQIEWRHVLIL
jgi:hypothetical protein